MKNLEIVNDNQGEESDSEVVTATDVMGIENLIENLIGSLGDEECGGIFITE
jgi:hypothetical protein